VISKPIMAYLRCSPPRAVRRSGAGYTRSILDSCFKFSFAFIRDFHSWFLPQTGGPRPLICHPSCQIWTFFELLLRSRKNEENQQLNETATARTPKISLFAIRLDYPLFPAYLACCKLKGAFRVLQPNGILNIVAYRVCRSKMV